MAAAFVKLGAERDGGIELTAINDAALGIAITGQAGSSAAIKDRAGDCVAVVVLREAVVGINPQAFEIGVHDEVDDTGHGVGTIGRRSTAGQHVNALDHRGRHEVKIGGRAGNVARHQAAAVDQHQGALRAEAAQIDRGGTGGTVRQGRGLAGEHLRQRVQQIFGTLGARLLDIGVTNRGNRRDRGQVGVLDAGPGDDEHRLISRGSLIISRSGILCKSGGGEQCNANRKRCCTDPEVREFFHDFQSLIARAVRPPVDLLGKLAARNPCKSIPEWGSVVLWSRECKVNQA